MRTPLRLFLSAGLGLLIAAAGNGRAADWTQFRGPNHDGSTSEKILGQWPEGGLHQVWQVPLNKGFSAMTVAAGKVFTLVQRAGADVDEEVCVALDAKTGKELWSAPLGVSRYDKGGDSGTEDNKGGDGPRSTPSYDDGRVYTYSARMVLQCLDAATGKQLWSHNIVNENSGKVIHWQNASSPLVEGGWVLVAGGGPEQSLLAFDKKTGRPVWKGQTEGLTHSTPVAATILGQRQVIFFTQSGLVSVKPATGEVLWKYPFRYATSTAISPVVSGDIVYCSAAYGIGAGACKITKADGGFAATQLWFQPADVINNHWSTPVCRDGYLYGLFGQRKFGTAPLECVEVSTGKVMWSHSGFGPGGCTLVNGNVLVLADDGDLVLVSAKPDAYAEVGRAHVLAGKCWNYASISNGRIYARSTKQGVCLEVP